MQKNLWKNLAIALCMTLGLIAFGCSETTTAPEKRLDPFSLQPRADFPYTCTYAEFSNGTEVWNCADYSLETVYVWGTPDEPNVPEDLPSCAVYGTCIVDSDPCIDNPEACGFTTIDNNPNNEAEAHGQDVGYENGDSDCSDPAGDGYGESPPQAQREYAAEPFLGSARHLGLNAPGPNAAENLAAFEAEAADTPFRRFVSSEMVGSPVDKACGLQQCLREITETEGQAILQSLLNPNGTIAEWTYTQGGAKGGVEPSRSITNKRGDCTDYTMNAVKTTIPTQGPTNWPHAWSQKMSTSMFHTMSDADLLNHGYVRVTVPRVGDIVVRGGHAGIFSGMNNGHVMGYADNGRPAVAGVDGSYKDGATGWYNFSPTTDKNGNPVNPEFFRPMVYSEYCDP